MHAAELGLTQKEIVDNVITALNSNTMIAPNYWVDHQTGNDYFLTVQYYENGPAGHSQLRRFDSRFRCERSVEATEDGAWRPGRHRRSPSMRVRPITVLGNVASLEFVQSPTEIDHYQIQRVADVYVTPSGEDLGKVTARDQQSSGWRRSFRPTSASICAAWCRG